MKILLQKGKAIVAYITVFAILSASLFTGAVITAGAQEACGGTITETWDKTSDGVALGDWYDGTFESGDGSAEYPYIITSAEELAYICRYGSEAGVYYKVDPSIKAFDMNTVSGIDLTVDTVTPDYLKQNLADAILGKVWFCDAPFKGSFDGNGVTIYGLRAGPAYYNQASFESGSKAGYTYGGLFGQVDTSTASIKNLKIKNSYFTGASAGAVFGYTTYSGGSIPIENCVVANCYIESTSGGYDAGAIGGRCQYNGTENISDKVLINNCLVYGNSIVNASGASPRLIGVMEAWHYNGSAKVHDAEHFSITNTVAIGCQITHSNYWTNYDAYYSNCYTTATDGTTAATVKVLSHADDAKGVEAISNLSGLSTADWFFNTTTYPELRVFHTTSVTDNNDGTHSETCGCGLVGVPVEHSTINGVCSACGYIDPCKDGHTLEAVEEISATETQAGTLAHDYCSVCKKTFIDGVQVSANDLIIPMLATSSEYSGTVDTKLLGSGTKASPYLITNADEFAAVALGRVASQDADGNAYYFKVMDGMRAFYINGGEELAAMTDIAEVKQYLTSNSVNDWIATGTFSGHFDGNGVTVYGVYSNNAQAGLFPKVGVVTIKNIAVKNSYFISSESSNDWYSVGGIVGYSAWQADSTKYGTITVENCTVANNYIRSQCSNATYGRAGTVVGNIYGNSVIINNCLVYGNEVVNGSRTAGYAPGFVSYASGGNSAFSNIIAIGTNPYTAGGGWHIVNSSKFTNVYTDRPVTTDEGAPENYGTLTKLTLEQMQGAAAAENIRLDEEIWFYNTKTYPQIRILHDITGDAVGVDGHINEKDVCCDSELLGDDVIPHTYNNYNVCTVCEFEFPCVDGHNFTDIPAVEASEEAPGNIAYKSCSQCKKNYSTDAALDAPVSSALTDNEIIIPQMLPYDEWNGTYDSYFWMNNEGDGSVANPFIIKSAEQLAAVATANLKYDANKTTSEAFDVNNYTINNGVLDTTGLHFKVRDGLTSFYMNGGETVASMTSVEDVKDYFESNTAYNWITVNTFGGTFNGNGATVYGLYSKDNRAAGLFPLVSLVTIKNVTLKNSYFVTVDGSHNNIAVGGIIGLGQYFTDSSKYGTVTIRACAVANSYLCSQNTDESYGRAGAIAGNMYNNHISIRDCLVYGNEVVNGSGISEDYASGLVAYTGGGNTAFKNIVSIGTNPYTAGGGWHIYDNSKFTNVYTDTAITIDDGAPQNYKNITKLTTEQMSGTAAQDNMPALDWVSAWQVNENGYPTPRVVNVRDYASGIAWTGEIAQEFPSGDGSKGSPYQIAAPEYLALMLNSDNEGVYYELTEDIMINDTSVEDWKSSATQWYTSSDVEAFAGYLNGNGHTVSGLYYDDIEPGDSVGLIPTKTSGDVTNIVIADSYIKCNTDAFVGAVIGSVVDSAPKPIVLQGVTVEDMFVVEGEAIAGGLIGKVGESVVRISNSISKATITATGRIGGMVADASAGTSIKNSISVGLAPVGEVNSATIKNVYTNVDTTLTGVTVLGDAAMVGDAAAENMSGLDFENIWTTVADGYPALAGVINSDNGIEGEVWSGSVASAYAGGDGSAENPYLIATAEQLARCVTNHAHGKHYKLIADIYLNDIDSAYWNIKVGCNEWYHNRSGASWALFKNGGSFDGDGYVVYGLYYERTGFNEANKGAYMGLFPTVGESSLIQNVAISHAYVAGSVSNSSEDGNSFSDSAGALIGSVVRWDNSYKDQIPSTSESKKITTKPEIWDKMPIIKNCLVDYSSYVAGTYAGGIIGYADEPYRVYDCIFTGSLKGMYEEHTGGIVGQDNANGAYYYRCVSLPQTCDRPYGGWANANWRTDESRWPTTVEDSYYFSMYKRPNSGTKIDNPTDRVGEAARNIMTALDWENNWMVIEDGTPIQQIFAKNHTVEQYTALSDRAFAAPYVTVSFMTDSDVKVDDMVGRMYSPITLPQISREGYTFTGWYVFDDCSIEYPLDYFPPRDLQLFAGWEPTGIIQNFENYTDTIFDYDIDQWRLNKPGAKGGYKNAYVRNGGMSMRLLDTNTDFADMLINYEDMLKIGQTYKMTFWVATDVANNPDTILKLVHNTLPEYNSENKGVEQMVVVKNLTVGEWTQYSYEFTALTPWISLRAGGNSSLYFDDIMIATTGKDVGYDALAKYLDTLDVSGGLVTDNGILSPNTSENITVTVLIAVILSCAVIVITSRKNLIEVIEN